MALQTVGLHALGCIVNCFDRERRCGLFSRLIVVTFKIGGTLALLDSFLVALTDLESIGLQMGIGLTNFGAKSPERPRRA